MKRKKIIIVLILIMFFSITTVFASEQNLEVIGDDKANINESKTLIIRMNSEEEIGVVSGKIARNDNIEEITVKGKNNWNLTYNKETGDFILLKAEGAKEEEIMSIEYLVGNNEGKGTITLNNLKLTTIQYETENLLDITKEIDIIKSENKDDKEDEKDEEELDDKETKDENKDEEELDNKETKDENKKDDKTNKEENESELDNTKANGEHPKTGSIRYIAIIGIVLIITILAYLFYKKNSYNN